MASELESDLQDIVDWGRKWLVDFNAGKTQLVSFDWSKNTGDIDVKMDGSVLEEKTSFKMLGLTSNLDDSGTALPVFPSRTNLKLHNISITPKMVKKVITNIDSSKTSGPDCIPVVVLKNCEPELSYILAKFFNNCLKESCFPDSWKVYC